jgi:hypothetical protein
MPNIDKQAALMRERGYLPINLAAHLLGVAPKTLRLHMDSHDLPGIRLGSIRYLTVDGLIAWYGRDSSESAVEIAQLLGATPRALPTPVQSVLSGDLQYKRGATRRKP